MPVTALLVASSALNVAATVPTYDVKPNRHAAVRLGGSGRTVTMCEAGEANGRKELAKEWSTFTEASKDGCIKRVGRHAPSYIELLVCLRSSTSSGGPLMPRWRVNFIGQYIGSVDAPDSETAISEAAKQFGITSAGRDRIVVKMIDSKPED